MIYQTHNSVGQYYFECIRYSDFSFVPHMHRHPEVFCVREGSIDVVTNGKRETFSKGEYGWIPSNSIHSYETLDSSVIDVCIYSEDFVPAFSKETRKKFPDRTKFVCRYPISRFVEDELFVTDREVDFFTRKAALYAVAGAVLEQIKFLDISAKNETLADKIIRYVAENYTEDISLKAIADELGYEERYLSRCFHNTVPMHFSAYVNLFRVDHAIALLQNTELSVSEVSMESGFQSIRSFNRVFHEITGKTPKDFM
ncbi:MAG: helix-turn-helix domain-containing protein [Clostridia bacterium]|nr:helix-turn-helix domain-containing protein [Clostridia bacterium]